MSTQVQQVLAELEAFGYDNDAKESEKQKRMRNVTSSTGAFLSFLIKAAGAKRILEIGTSNGYSTIWMANAVDPREGAIVTLEVDEAKARMATDNFVKAGVAELIELRLGDAGGYLQTAPTDSVDFIFIDSDRVEYPTWWADLQRILVPGGVIVVDNTMSHHAELKDFIELVANTSGIDSTLMQYEQGLLLINKR